MQLKSGQFGRYACFIPAPRSHFSFSNLKSSADTWLKSHVNKPECVKSMESHANRSLNTWPTICHLTLLWHAGWDKPHYKGLFGNIVGLEVYVGGGVLFFLAPQLPTSYLSMLWLHEKKGQLLRAFPQGFLFHFTITITRTTMMDL